MTPAHTLPRWTVAAALAAVIVVLVVVGRAGRLDAPRAVAVPKIGSGVADVLVDGTPVLVVHEAAGDVRAFDARVPATGLLDLPRLVAWCEGPAVFIDPHSGRVYDPAGRAYLDARLIGGRAYGTVGFGVAPDDAVGLAPLEVVEVSADGRLARLGEVSTAPVGPSPDFRDRELRKRVFGVEPLTGEPTEGPLPCWPPRPDEPIEAHRLPRWPDPARLVSHGQAWPSQAVTPEQLATAGGDQTRLVTGHVVRLPDEPSSACAELEGSDPPRCPDDSPAVDSLPPLDDTGFTHLHGRFLARPAAGGLTGLTLLPETRVDGTRSGEVEVVTGRFRAFGRRFGDAVELVPDDRRDLAARRCALGRSTDGSLALAAAERPIIIGRERLAGMATPVPLDKDALAELLVPGAEVGPMIEVRLDPVTCEAWRIEELP